jgi:hypothetical protein
MRKLLENAIITQPPPTSPPPKKFEIDATCYIKSVYCLFLRHCATSQKVAGSIPEGVFGIFH